MATGVSYKDMFNEAGKTKLISSEELIKAELELLLAFPRYSLFFGNNIGLDCERYLGLRSRVATFNLIKADIEKLFSKYKRVALKEIKMEFNKETDSIDIELTCLLSGSTHNSIKIPLSLTN